MSDIMEKAVRNVGVVNTMVLGDKTLTIALLRREQDWTPLHAPWWRGKEVCVIGADINGNFFLRHCDGSVRYWDHKAQSDTVVAPSVKEFVRKIQLPPDY